MSFTAFRLKPYRRSDGMLYIGAGRNLDKKGISIDELSYLLTNDIQACLVDLLSLMKDFSRYPELVQLVLLDLRFALGASGLRGFKNMLAAVESHDWVNMKQEIINSRWYRTHGPHGRTLTNMIDQVIAYDATM